MAIRARYKAIWRGVEDKQVFAAQYVGDAHQGIVNRVHQGVERLAVGADHHEVRNRTGLEGDFPAHQVGEGQVLIRHAHAQHRFAALGTERCDLLFAQLAVVAVIAQLRVPAGCLVAFLDLFGGGEGFVDVTACAQLGNDVLVDVPALGLAVGLVRPADVDALIPGDSEPVQGVEQLVVALLGVALGVGVFDAEDHLSAGVARIGPVEQGGADQAYVRSAGRRRAEAYADGSFIGHGGNEGYISHDVTILCRRRRSSRQAPLR